MALCRSNKHSKKDYVSDTRKTCLCMQIYRKKWLSTCWFAQHTSHSTRLSFGDTLTNQPVSRCAVVCVAYSASVECVTDGSSCSCGRFKWHCGRLWIQEGQLFLIFAMPNTPFPADGIRYQDQEQRYVIPAGNGRVCTPLHKQIKPC